MQSFAQKYDKAAEKFKKSFVKRKIDNGKIVNGTTVLSRLNEEVIKGQIKELVRGSVEETLNELLEKEAESLTQAARYERSEARQGYRSGHYDRNLTTTSGDVTLHMPRLKGVSFETAIIERYRRRESSVEEALIEMYLAGVSVRG